MGLRDIESSLPPGFRFYPSDEELVCHYLYNKVTNERITEGTMVEVDLHTREPWELPVVAKLSANEWYFFSFRDRKYATGSRTNRATKSGYWKATGKDRTVYDPTTHAIVGMRKTLVFYKGRAPNGTKSCWVMHEFRLETPQSPPKEDWVLCRVVHKRKVETKEDTGCSSATVDSPPSLRDNPTDDGFYEQKGSSTLYNPTVPLLQGEENNCSSSNILNTALLQCNFLDYQEGSVVGPTTMLDEGPRDGDGYANFLLDVGVEGHFMGGGGVELPRW